MNKYSLVPWSHGSYGKGAVFDDLALVLWKVDGIDGHPHHETACAALGRSDLVPIALWVKPNGAVSALIDRSFPPVDDLARRLRAVHPELRVVSDDEWDLA